MDERKRKARLQREGEGGECYSRKLEQRKMSD